MSLESDVRYLRDRFEIQDKIALYGLGQDLHQPGAANQNILEQWGELFTADAEIDCRDVGLKVFGLREYAEMMRGPKLEGGGLDVPFDVWQHIEGHATVKIDGDVATSIAPHVHTHGVRGQETNFFAVGYWHDRWERRPEGWRITHRRLQQLYLHNFTRAPNPDLFGIEFDKTRAA